MSVWGAAARRWRVRASAAWPQVQQPRRNGRAAARAPLGRRLPHQQLLLAAGAGELEVAAGCGGASRGKVGAGCAQRRTAQQQQRRLAGASGKQLQACEDGQAGTRSAWRAGGRRSRCTVSRVQEWPSLRSRMRSLFCGQLAAEGRGRAVFAHGVSHSATRASMGAALLLLLGPLQGLPLLAAAAAAPLLDPQLPQPGCSACAKTDSLPRRCGAARGRRSAAWREHPPLLGARCVQASRACMSAIAAIFWNVLPASRRLASPWRAPSSRWER